MTTFSSLTSRVGMLMAWFWRDRGGRGRVVWHYEMTVVQENEDAPVCNAQVFRPAESQLQRHEETKKGKKGKETPK